jgi:hypothetical protein
MINRIPILNDYQCDEIVKKLYSLQTFWIPRYKSHMVRFSTLGFASYLDENQHVDDIRIRNQIILENFSDVLDLVKDSLLPILGSFEFDEHTPIPGFHIFESFEDGIDARDTKIHVDIPYQKYQFTKKFTNIDYDNPVNFTLTLELPTDGGGINMWDVVEDPTHFQLNYDSIVENLKTPEYFAYNKGELSYFFGYPIHQIAKKSTIRGDRRITIQGHGLKCDNKWIIYF